MFWYIFWYSIWHSIRHSTWHSMWYSVWQSIWHILWHCIWHPTWHSVWDIFWHFIWHSSRHSICILSSIHLAFYLTYILTFYLAPYLTGNFWHSIWNWHYFAFLSGFSIWHRVRVQLGLIRLISWRARHSVGILPSGVRAQSGVRRDVLLKARDPRLAHGEISHIDQNVFKDTFKAGSHEAPTQSQHFRRFVSIV